MPPDFRRLSRGQSTAAIVVASAATAVSQKNSAAFICDGVDDDIELQAALDSLAATGGKIVLTDGTFYLSETVTRAINNVTIEGAGQSTQLIFNDTDYNIEAGGYGWSIRELTTDAGSTSPAPIIIGDVPASSGLVDLGTPLGGTIQPGGIVHVIGSNLSLFPAPILEGTSTDQGDYDASTFVDSALTIVLNAYVSMVVGVTSTTDGVAYAAIDSNTTDGTFVLDGSWVDPNGDACAVPDGGLYLIWDLSTDVNTLSGGSGNQLLYLTVNQSQIPFSVTATLKTGVDNIILSGGGDRILATTVSTLLVRRPSEQGVTWHSPLQ